MKEKILVIFISLLLLLSGCSRILDIINNKNNDDNLPIIEDITVEQAYNLIQKNKGNENFIILDVRTVDEYNAGHIENAINLNVNSSTFREDLNNYNKNMTYLIYCRSGSRSRNAANIAENLGFMEVYNMLGGITQWIAAGYPTVK